MMIAIIINEHVIIRSYSLILRIALRDRLSKGLNYIRLIVITPNIWRCWPLLLFLRNYLQWLITLNMSSFILSTSINTLVILATLDIILNLGTHRSNLLNWRTTSSFIFIRKWYLWYLMLIILFLVLSKISESSLLTLHLLGCIPLFGLFETLLEFWEQIIVLRKVFFN